MKDDKYVKKKKDEMYLKLVDCKRGNLWPLLDDFIRTIVEDCQVKVSKIETRRVWNKIACQHCEDIMPDDFIKWLEEAGVEVEG